MSEPFEPWLRSVCFQKPTPEAYDLAKCAWDHMDAKLQATEELAQKFAEAARDACIVGLAQSAKFRQAEERIAELEAALRDATNTIASFDGLIGYGPDCDEKIARYEALLGEGK